MTHEDPRITEIRAMREKAYRGSQQRIDLQRAKGKLTVRERLSFLLDPGTFHELEPFITQTEVPMRISDEEFLGDGVTTGYGQISRRTIYVYAQDFTIYAGTLTMMQSRSWQKAIHEFPLPKRVTVSAWQSVLRSNIQSTRGNVR